MRSFFFLGFLVSAGGFGIGRATVADNPELVTVSDFIPDALAGLAGNALAADSACSASFQKSSSGVATLGAAVTAVATLFASADLGTGF
jgi:hypothetical protein